VTKVKVTKVGNEGKGGIVRMVFDDGLLVNVVAWPYIP